MGARPLLALAALFLLTVGAGAAVREEVVSFESFDGLELEGILSLPPEGEGPFPGLLLIHGSGLHDADHEIDIPELGLTRGQQEHFKKLARYFSRRRLAVLRYNKRGASFDHEQDNPRLLTLSTLDDLVEDARSALQTLYGDPRVDATRLVVWGWSEGTMLAPRLARDHDEITAIVLVGPVARAPEALIRYQVVDRYVAFYRQVADESGDGAVSLAELDRIDGVHGVSSFYVYNLADLLYGLSGAAIQRGAEVNGFRPELDTDGDGQVQIDSELVPWLETFLAQTLEDFRSVPYFNSALEAKAPVRTIQKVRAKILIVQGEADNQTPLAEGEALAAKLDRRRRTNWELLTFPGLGHSLSEQTDIVTDDGGLTVFDNPTLNVMKRRTRKAIWKRLRDHLER